VRTRHQIHKIRSARLFPRFAILRPFPI
jgi:hypothetical protein